MIHRYDLWKYRVDLYLLDKIGMDSDTCEDWLWRDAFDAGITPIEAAKQFLVETRPSLVQDNRIGSN